MYVLVALFKHHLRLCAKITLEISNLYGGSRMANLYLPFNTLRPRQNGTHFADNIFKCISLNEKFCILIQISLKFVHKCLIDINIGSGNGLVPNKWQAITWSNADPFHWRIYLALVKLSAWCKVFFNVWESLLSDLIQKFWIQMWS